MAVREELLRLKQEYSESKRHMDGLGEKSPSTVIELSEWLGELMEGIEHAKAKGEKMEAAPIIPKMKLMRKSAKLSRGVRHFEAELVSAFDRGDISEGMARRFASVLKQIKSNKLRNAKSEFRYFEELLKHSSRMGRAGQRIEEERSALHKEQARMKGTLEEMGSLEKESFDSAKAQAYGRYLENMEKLKALREEYLHSLSSRPVLEMLAEAERLSLDGHSFPPIGEEEGQELRKFISENPELVGFNAARFCELCDYSEEKLRHICPEVSRFKKVVAGSRGWLESVRNLHSTRFIEVDGRSPKVLEFYAKNVEGAKEAAESVIAFAGEQGACREEHEKARRLKERRKELSKYSREGLEAELAGIRELLELLDSEVVQDEGPKEDFLSKISSFFRN